MKNRLTKVADQLENQMEKTARDYLFNDIDAMQAYVTAEWLRETATSLFIMADQLCEDKRMRRKDRSRIKYSYEKIVEKHVNLMHILHKNGFSENKGGTKYVGRDVCERTEIPFPQTERNV